MEMWGHGAYPLHFMPSQCINIGNNRPTRKRRGGRGHAVHMQAVVVMMVAVWARGLWSSKTSRKAVKTKTFPWFCIVVRRKGSLSTLRLRLTPFCLLLSCWSFWILTSPTGLHTVLPLYTEIVQFNISNEINCHTVHPIVSYIWILIHHCIDKVSEEIGT